MTYVKSKLSTPVSGGTPFHKTSGQSVSGAGIITSLDGNPTIDGTLFTGFNNGSNYQGVPAYISFSTSASITSGTMSGLTFPSRPTSIAMPARTTSPTTYTNPNFSFTGTNSGSENTWIVANIGTNMGFVESLFWYSGHSGISSGYPPNGMDWQWWLYVNSADTSNLDVQVGYGIHQSGSYSIYNVSAVNGLNIFFRGVLKLRLRMGIGNYQATSSISATVAGYW